MPNFILSLPVTLTNTGTAFMWAEVFHLFLGNTIIGIVEGLLLARLFKCSRWRTDGILAENKVTKERVRYALETPFLAWHIGNAVQLEDGKVLFKLAADQICLLDVEAKWISLITRGKSPLIIKSTNADDASTKVPEPAIESSSE